MERSTIIVLLIVGIVLVLGVGTYLMFFPPRAPIQTTTEVIPITYANFEEQIQRQSLVHDLPAEAALQLQFYKTAAGEQTVEQSYILTQDSVAKGTLDNPDIIIKLDAKHLQGLTNQNFCDVIASAHAQGDLDIDLHLSKTALAWKYRSMTRYRSCLGF